MGGWNRPTLAVCAHEPNPTNLCRGCGSGPDTCFPGQTRLALLLSWCFGGVTPQIVLRRHQGMDTRRYTLVFGCEKFRAHRDSRVEGAIAVSSGTAGSPLSGGGQVLR